MSTPEIDVQLLRTLHRILRQKTDLEDRLQRGPKQVAIAKNGEVAFQQTLEETKASLKETKMAADRKQLQLGEREARIEDLKKKRNACESNREFQLLADQIAADEAANSVQSDEILELLERLDEIEGNARQAEENLKKGQAETKRVESKVDSELAIVQADLDVVLDELKAAEAKLPRTHDIKSTYDRLVAAVGEEALAAVEENCCGHCYTSLTTQVQTELMMNRVFFCKNCGSLLYLSENAKV